MMVKKLLAASTATATAAVYLLSTTASAYHTGETHHGGWSGMGGMGGGWFGFFMMLLWTLVLVAVVVGVIYWAFGQRKGDEGEGKSKIKSEREAVEILRERYARGEIDSEEFRERKRQLTEG